VILAVSLLTLAEPARALITRPIPLRLVLAETRFICVARVERIDPARPAAVLQVEEHLKGKYPHAQIPINLKGDKEAEKLQHTPQLLKRLAPKVPLVLFVNQREKRLTAFGYTNGTWFQMIGHKGEEGKRIVWAFTHCEPFLRRTFKGTTEEMRQVVIDGLAGKKKPPEPDEKVKPGLGPEIPQPPRGSRIEDRGSKNLAKASAENAAPRSSILDPRSSILRGGPPLAVIPTLGVGGPLAILAVLFPSLFGGVLLLFKRWAAFFTVISINSLLYCLHLWWAGEYLGAWWTPPAVLWFIMTVVTLLGAAWAWQRHFRTVMGDQVLAEAPARTEHTVLWLLSLSCLGVVLFLWLSGPPQTFETWWNLLLAFSIGIWAGTLYKLGHSLLAAPRPVPVLAGAPQLLAERAPAPALAGAPSERVSSLAAPPVLALANGPAPPGMPPPRRPARPALPTEGVMLWVVLLVSLTYAAFRPGLGGAAGQDIVAEAGEGPSVKLLLKECRIKSDFEGNGSILSSPLVADNRIYVAAACGAADRYGRVYCLNASTREVLWTFSNDGAMKQVYCTPCLADGRLYIGEGFHEDKNCNLYCLDAKTGKKLWEFATESHTEARPTVAHGRVYFGAGDDGVYCLDAVKGTKIWQLPGPQRRKKLHLHVDSRPAVVGKRVYVGGGIDEDTGECDPAIACIDADTGKEIWVHATPRWMVRRGGPPGEVLPLPAWGAPVVDGAQVFYGLGNGRITESSRTFEPIGALWCVDADTGKELWAYKVGDGVLNTPVVDRQRVYFGSRDGHCYALERKTGKLVWKKAMGSPVVATPALAGCPQCGHNTALYALGVEGRVCCIDPRTGKELWRYTDLEKFAPALASCPAVVTRHGPEGDRRYIYFGAALNSFTTQGLCRVVDLAKEQ
jgi:outer membrane protein assembly factor BamB